MPLVYAGAPVGDRAVSEAHARARKIKKQYAEGRLVRVASARHQAEAELIMGLLLEEGVPAMAKRSGGFDVPDMMFAGPRDIFVPESGAEVAREVLGTVDQTPPSTGTSAGSTRGLAIVLSVVLAVAGISPLAIWLYSEIHG